jgi:hypothetical protein
MSTCIEYSHNINIKNTTALSFDIQVKGVLIKYKKKIYLTLPHAGLDVNIIIFNNKEYTKFKYSHWSENIIVEIDEKDVLEHQYIFKKFGLKCIDVNKKIKINDIDYKYIKNDYFPVDMMVNNPNLMYYVVKSKETFEPETGMPLYYNNILYGIYSKYNNEKKFCYVIPSLFIEKSINNVKNNLYVCNNIDNIKSIDRYKVYGDMIYCPQFQYNIKLDTYLLYLSNSENRITYNNSHICHISFSKKLKKDINNTFLLHWCKMFNKEILIEIIKNYDSCYKKLEFKINNKKHIFVYD